MLAHVAHKAATHRLVGASALSTARLTHHQRRRLSAAAAADRGRPSWTSRYQQPERASVDYSGSTQRDVIIIGGGHNGLIAAAYLARAGVDVLCLERRHTVGGAAVTEEIVPGFKFSRASYLAGLLRPQIIQDLNLEKYNFKYLPRDPSSFTPGRPGGPYEGKSLMFWSDAGKTYDSIAQFSKADAEVFEEYENTLDGVRDILQPFLDAPPPSSPSSAREWTGRVNQVLSLLKSVYRNRKHLLSAYELFTAPATHVLDRWFQSDILKTTLATDAIIGSMSAPSQPGSAYVLLHHVMGEAAGKKGVWAYVEGGMGAVSQAIASSAREAGADIVVNAPVDRILVKNSRGLNKARVAGVELADGSRIFADKVLTNCTPYHTFEELLPSPADGLDSDPVPSSFRRHIRHVDYSCGAFKINCAVQGLPNFLSMPNKDPYTAGPQHRGTIHFENHMHELERAAAQAQSGVPATQPVIEMTIPSAVDPTLSDTAAGKHVVQLFVQYAPYHVNPQIGSWQDENFKREFVERVFRVIDTFAPGFSSSVIGYDALSPVDLEQVFGLHQGNIFHGALSLHQLGYMRPAPGYSSYHTPVDGLYVCGSGAHPGGGVMGAPGRNCAQIVLKHLGQSPSA